MTDKLLLILDKEARQTDAEGIWPARSIQALRDSGLMGLTLPADAGCGGAGGGMRQFAEAIEKNAEHCASTAMIYFMHVCGANMIAASSSPRRAGLVKTMTAGKAVATLAFSEKGSRSHFWAPVSRASSNSSSTILNCEKSFVTSAGHADFYVVSTGAIGAKSPIDSTLYIVEKNA